MKVVLLRHTPDPDKTAALSARLCYSPVGVPELQEAMSEEEAGRLVRMLVRMGHFSPLEHVTFTFAIEGVSRVLTHQLVRHRIASYSQQSQRYVKAHDFASVIPHTIEQIPEAKAKFEACMQGLQNLYNDLADNYGIPAEDARYVLPNAAETKIVCTFNARSLYNFFTLRFCISSPCAAAAGRSGKFVNWLGVCWCNAVRSHRYCLKKPARIVWRGESAKKGK